MKTSERKSLDQKLKEAGKYVPYYLPVFTAYIDDYFLGLSQICENGYWKEIYRNEIYQYGEEKGSLPRLYEMAPIADSLAPAEKRNLLYRILVEPYALLQIKEEERKGERL